MPVPERRFNEAEVAAIIERATKWRSPPAARSVRRGSDTGSAPGDRPRDRIAPNVIAGAADVVKDGGTTVIDASSGFRCASNET